MDYDELGQASALGQPQPSLIPYFRLQSHDQTVASPREDACL